MRNPVDRASELYEDWKLRQNDPNLQIRAFIESTDYQDNFLTRSLTNVPNDILTTYDLGLAKDILQKKFVVGLSERMEESFERFEKYFGWNDLTNSKPEKCLRHSLQMGSLPESPTVSVEDLPDFISLNKFDLDLYYFAEELFERQADLI